MPCKSLVASAALAILLGPQALLAGDETRFVTIGQTEAGKATGAGSEGFQVVVTGGDGASNVLVVSDRGQGARHELNLQVEDGRIVVETEPDPDRPWLGVLLTPVDGGIRVNSVMEDSPAERAGLRAGDVVTRIGDRDVTGEGEQDDILAGLQPGDALRLTVERDGDTERLRARLGTHPGRVAFPLAEGLGPLQIAGDVLGGIQGLRQLESLKGLRVLPFFDCEGEDCPLGAFNFSFSSRKPRLGVVLEDLSPQLARFFEVEPGEGMLIQEVLEGSVAQRAGLSAGDVLLRIGDTDVSDVHDIREALSSVGKGESVRIEVMRRGSRESLRAELDTDAPAVRDSGRSFSSGEGGFRFSVPKVEWKSDGASHAPQLLGGEARQRLEEALREGSAAWRALSERERERDRVAEDEDDSKAETASELLRFRKEAERTF